MMQKLKIPFILSLLLLSSFAARGAGYFWSDGVKYSTSGFEAIVEEILSSKEEIVIPERVLHDKFNYKVTGIKTKAAQSNKVLKSLTIAGNVKYIGDFAFSQCVNLSNLTLTEGLTSINAFAFSGTKLHTVNLPSSVKSVGQGAFSSISTLENINVEEGNESYASENGILYSKNKLTIVQYPSGRTGEFSIPETTITIGYSAFAGSKLSEIFIPNSVKELQLGAFGNNEYLSSLVLPESVTIINCNFSNCKLNPLVITSKEEINFEAYTPSLDLNEESTIITTRINYEKVKSLYTKGDVLILEDQIPIDLEQVSSTYFTVSFKFKDALWAPYLPKDVEYSYEIFNGETLLLPDTDGLYTAKVLTPGEVVITVKWTASDGESGICIYRLKTKDCDILAYGTPGIVSYAIGSVSVPYAFEKPKKIEIKFNYTDEVVEYKEGSDITFKYLLPETSYSYTVTAYYDEGEMSKSFAFTTKKLSVGVDPETTQTSIKIKDITLPYDLKEVADKIELILDGKRFEFNNKTVTFSNLPPQTKYSLSVYVYYGYQSVWQTYTIWTKEINPRIDVEEVGPTSIRLRGAYAEGDAVISETGFESFGEGAELIATGLQPDTDYDFKFYVITDKGNRYEATRRVTTEALTLVTLKPKCVSATCAIVAAQTNILEDEANVGFQWKKYDAPASLEPNEGYAVVYDGMAEGYVKNLQSTSYYNVRAFYKSTVGTYYYGDWVTFDPSDFSYFEPTVHTYPVLNINDNTATVRAYALAGTENIESQGIQYWVLSTKSRGFGAPSANEIMSVEASGQIMTITLDNLRPGTEYAYRAFVKTASGYTYGEEQTFTTTGTSGIGDVLQDCDNDVEIVGYYDLYGRKSDSPRQGINIVVYSNGETKKIVVK